MELNLLDFNEFIYSERKRQGMNQNQLSKASGVDHTMISRYENFKDLKVSTMVKLLKGLGYSPIIEIKDAKDLAPINYWRDKYYALIKQEHPERCKGCDTADDFVHLLATSYLSMYDEMISLVPVMASNFERRNTIAYCEESYEQGYSAIINDGKLVGFRREIDEEK